MVRRWMGAGAMAMTAMLSLSAAARPFTPHSFRDEIAVLGMGGAYTAGAWRGSGLFYNPASLARKRFHLNVPIRAELGGIGGLGQLKGVTDYFRNNRKDLEDVDQLLPDRLAALDQRAEALDDNGAVLRVFPAVRLGWQHVSVQTYVVLDGAPQMNAGVFQPRLDLSGFGDAGVIAGYGHTFHTRDHTWYAGVAGKSFLRWRVNRSFVPEEAARESQIYNDLVNSIGEDRRYGIGIDAGVQVPLAKTFVVGVAAQDLATFGQVRPEMCLNAGIYYRILPRIHLVADYHDLLDAEALPIPMHVYFGGELDLTLVRLRAGAYQGYPTFGMGINLWLMKIDFVYYSRERGRQLGDQPEDNLAFELEFGLD